MSEPKAENKPVVSVIIPVYNGQRYLAETIDSVIAQNMTDWEIIAVNDGSTDRSPAILEEYTRKEPGRIRFVTVKNGGVSRARNAGVALARGTFIAFIDQDDLWAPEKIGQQVAQFNNNEKLGLSFTNESIIDETGTVVLENVLKLGPRQHGKIFECLLFDNFIPISSVMVKKELFLNAGGFNPAFSLAEDYDFLLKIARVAPVDYINEPLLRYREHGESGTHTRIDRITAEAREIIGYWKQQDPGFFRKHYVKYQKFCLKFKFLKCKILLKKCFAGFTR
ncbi:MAG: glycosyltransferase [Methanoregula sp.]|nr:glycosyltransferase [Methanoregula sp.]